MTKSSSGTWVSAPPGSVSASSAPKHELRKITRQLDSINLKGAKADRLIFERLQLLHAYLPTRTIGTAVNQTYFRVRKDAPKKIQSISELKSRPASDVTDYQRCNKPAQSMFYASDLPATALSEVEAQKDEEIYLCRWRCLEEIPVNHTMVAALSDSSPVTRNEAYIVKYFRRKFIENINPKFPHRYGLTARVAEFLTTAMPDGGNHNIREDGLTGLVFPSVKDPDKRWNVALHPEIVERSLILEEVVQAIVTSISTKGYQLRIEDTSQSIGPSSITWSGIAGESISVNFGENRPFR